MQQEYFENYLLKIRKLKQTTVAHYRESLRKIAQVLKEANFEVPETIYEIDSYQELMRIKRVLKEDKGFVALDERGNRMYLAGFNRYIEFVEGKGFKKEISPLKLLDFPVDAHPSYEVVRQIPYRDRILVRQVIIAAEHTCETNANHVTFTSARFKTQYMEGHHLIPMNQQGHFDNSLDVYSNLVSLCPICHRLLHHGIESERKPVLRKLYDERKERLQSAGIRIGVGEFFELTDSRATGKIEYALYQ